MVTKLPKQYLKNLLSNCQENEISSVDKIAIYVHHQIHTQVFSQLKEKYFFQHDGSHVCGTKNIFVALYFIKNF